MQQASSLFGTRPLPAPNPITGLTVKSLYTHPDSMAATSTAPKWAQKTITLPPQRRGCHLITPKIVKEIGQDLSGFKCGLAHLFLQHTSASLTINENYDSDVRDDTETFLNRVVPEVQMTCQHTSSHQCLVAHSRFQLQMDSLTWELGRCVS
ncbi:UPF0047 protein C4A8.02c isoform X2 [Cornus florida]|uniref:UPF0047 protein C4A8.02c isoform X2 n=1 Tax=Cornus florida TaxID=4283 RepID=UPI00289DC0EE|nr:UPF0047 protein C4A8.02c isoform X2 [Cornus florida]